MYGRAFKAAPRWGRPLLPLYRSNSSPGVSIGAAVVEAVAALSVATAIGSFNLNLTEVATAIDSISYAGASAITPAMTVTRLTGYPPLAVNVDALGTTSSNVTMSTTNGGLTVNALHSINFGNPSAGNHVRTGLPRNTQIGMGIAAHVYRYPGTYRITDTIVHTGTASVQIFADVVITDLLSVNTIVVNGTGTNDNSGPVNDGSGPCTYQANMPSAAGCNGKRILIKGGLTVSIPGLTGSQWAHFKGINGKPNCGNVYYGGTGSVNNTVFENLSAAVFNLNGARCFTLDCDTASAPHDSSFGGLACVVGDGGNYPNGAPTNNYNSYYEIFLSGNDFRNTLPSSFYPSYSIYGGGNAWGGIIDNITAGGDHDVRTGGMFKTFFGHNHFTGLNNTSNGIVKIHAAGYIQYINRVATPGPGPYENAYGSMADNIFNSPSGCPAYASLMLEPQNNTPPNPEQVRGWIAERNRFYIGNTGGFDISYAGPNIATIGNTRIGAGGAIGAGVGRTVQAPVVSGPYPTARL